jgi:hypothetical protein
MVESVRLYHPNVQLITGKRIYACVGAYIPPGDYTTIDTITRAIKNMPSRLPIIILGDLNADILRPHDDRAAQVASMAADFGLEDLLRHFRQRKRFQLGIMWRIRRAQGILTSKCPLFALIGGFSRTW